MSDDRDDRRAEMAETPASTPIARENERLRTIVDLLRSENARLVSVLAKLSHGLVAAAVVTGVEDGLAAMKSWVPLEEAEKWRTLAISCQGMLFAHETALRRTGLALRLDVEETLLPGPCSCAAGTTFNAQRSMRGMHTCDSCGGAWRHVAPLLSAELVIDGVALTESIGASPMFTRISATGRHQSLSIEFDPRRFVHETAFGAAERIYSFTVREIPKR